jgi:hypothetical protein
MHTVRCCLLALLLLAETSGAQPERWMRIIPRTALAVRYYAPSKSGSFRMIEGKTTSENAYSIVKQYSDGTIDVRLTFRKYGSDIEVSGNVENLSQADVCFTLRTVFPADKWQTVYWGHDLDSTEKVEPRDIMLSNYVDARTVLPPAGAFNVTETQNGGYGDRVGTGLMSFYPLACISADSVGLGWGVDMGIPVVFRLSYEPLSGMVAEFDLALSKETVKFPGRAYFKLHLFQFNHDWHLRGAFEKYYQLQTEYFKKRVPQEGIWLPFAPLFEIQGWKDFGFGVHETSFSSRDRGLDPVRSAIEAGKSGGVLTFQYTEPWEEEVPIRNLGATYEQVTSTEAITSERAEYIHTSAALDKENKYIARKLETPWLPTGWAVSINTNPDPDIKGFNRYDEVCRREIYPALAMNVDGVYFDCIEWHWQYDMNYNRNHFQYADYPLTFSSSLDLPRPVIWNYASEYEFINKVASEMHQQGKYVMGNTFYWIPFAAGILDVFGSELNWYINDDTKMSRLQFIRAMAYQKPAVFLLNEGLDDTVFTQLPYAGYKRYFERMLFYGFFPSFFSVDASHDIYWADSAKYNRGRAYFKKYVPILQAISEAGWQPVTSAKLSSKQLKIERFGGIMDSVIYFTVYNPNATLTQTTVLVDAEELALTGTPNIEEMIDGTRLMCAWHGKRIEIPVTVHENSARVLKVTKQ